MKLRNIILGAAIAGLASAQPVLADCGNCEGDKHKDKHSAAMSTDGEKSDMSAKQSAEGKSFRISKLKDTSVKSKDGKKLGEIEDLVLDPQTGKIKYAVLGTGGFLGIGENRVPVPWSQINVESESQFSLKVDQEKLQSAPKLDKDFANLNDPSFASTVDQFYSDTAVGGSDDLESATETEMEPSDTSSSSTESSDTESPEQRTQDLPSKK